MSLLKELKIEGFRCFESLTVGGLTRVNLIVGANNSGKTALLEAVEIFATNVAAARLCTTANRRGELVNHHDRVPRSQAEYTFDLRQLFRGRPDSLEEVRTFSIHSGIENIRVSTFSQGDDLGLLVKEKDGAQRRLHLSSDIGISSDDVTKLSRRASDVANVMFVPSGNVAPDVVRELWSEVVGTSAEQLVQDLLGLVDDRVEKLVVAPLPRDSVGWEGVYLRLARESKRLPISSFGDGMKKAAQLALALVRAKGGVLLIDELDDGLHYSALAELWRFLVVAARQLEVQVFATTHSKDCLESIAELSRADPSLAVDISVHRLDVGEMKSADSDARAAANLIDAGMELR